MTDRADFVKGMRLTDREITALERQLGVIEQAAKNRLDFVSSDTVAFTPGALLVVATAEFAYRVYQDYGRVALAPEELQRHLKDVATRLADLESSGDVALSLDLYTKLRHDLMGARKA